MGKRRRGSLSRGYTREEKEIRVDYMVIASQEKKMYSAETQRQERTGAS